MSGLNQPGRRIAKTTKLFIKGEFPRTESGRSFPVTLRGSDQVYAHLCQASRKDLRGAVEAAQGALKAWSGRTAYNRAQILYRMAEMMEGKRVELEEALTLVVGLEPQQVKTSLDEAINSLVYYAGFADKFSQVMASVNPVSGPFHNFTTPEPVGVVGLLYDTDFQLDLFISQIASVISSGNTLVAIFDAPGAALLSELGEIFKTSDLPAGVINLLSGHLKELDSHLGQHMEVHSLLYAGNDQERLHSLKEMAIENMKRVVHWSFPQKDLSPIVAFTEDKTVWHPVGL
jgi:acyl-CoA reductase-like NAD-dependent aldehyde dehydrogenase